MGGGREWHGLRVRENPEIGRKKGKGGKKSRKGKRKKGKKKVKRVLRVRDSASSNLCPAHGRKLGVAQQQRDPNSIRAQQEN